MNSLPFRQVHLDFHTSGAIAGIGSRFSKEQFQKALKLGHVNSITVFSSAITAGLITPPVLIGCIPFVI